MGKNGFLTSAAAGEDVDQEGSALEEQYEKLFPKIGRDFIFREDFEDIMQQILLIVDPLGLTPIDFSADGLARRRAREYKAFLDQDQDGSEVYKDLINLDDDDA